MVGATVFKKDQVLAQIGSSNVTAGVKSYRGVVPIMQVENPPFLIWVAKWVARPKIRTVISNIT